MSAIMHNLFHLSRRLLPFESKRYRLMLRDGALMLIKPLVDKKQFDFLVALCAVSKGHPGTAFFTGNA